MRRKRANSMNKFTRFKFALLQVRDVNHPDNLLIYADTEYEEVENLGDSFTADEALKAFKKYLAWTYETCKCYIEDNAEDDVFNADTANVCERAYAALINEKAECIELDGDVAFFIYI